MTMNKLDDTNHQIKKTNATLEEIKAFLMKK